MVTIGSDLASLSPSWDRGLKRIYLARKTSSRSLHQDESDFFQRLSGQTRSPQRSRMVLGLFTRIGSGGFVLRSPLMAGKHYIFTNTADSAKRGSHPKP